MARTNKITKGAKGASKSMRALRHLLFNHPVHQKDRQEAAKLRARGGIPIAVTAPKKMVAPFPGAENIGKFFRIAKNSIGSLISIELDKGAKVDSKTGAFPCPESEKFYKRIFKNRDFYLRNGKRKPDGTYYQKKEKIDGVRDNSLGLPAGWTKLFRDYVEKGILPARDLAESLESIGLKLLETQAHRTGYEPLYISIHPDSESNIQFHFGVAAVDPESHKLLGRSATGKKGRKGLREAGFGFLNVWRHAQKAKLTPEELIKFEEKFLKLPKLAFAKVNTNWDGSEKMKNAGFDDIALAVRLEQLLKEEFPHFADVAEKNAVEMGTKWARDIMRDGRTHIQKNQTIDRQRSTIKRLKAEPFFGKTDREIQTIINNWKSKKGIK